MDERNPLPGRVNHRLNLDSDEEEKRQEEERLEREEYEREKEEKRKRKEEKRKAKEEEERIEQEEALKKAEEKKKKLEKYNAPGIMFEPDSDSDVSFTRLKKKADEMYPQFAKKKKRESSDDEDDDSDGEEEEESESNSEDDSSSEEESESSHKKKKNKKESSREKPRRHRDEDSGENRPSKKKEKTTVKVEAELSGKDRLVQEVAVRWAYALPEWPPVDYDYEGELKKKGYRLVDVSKFKFVDEVVGGLTKVMEIDGYRGVFRSKVGLVDVRPKDSCPSWNYFLSKSEEELTKLLKIAYSEQLAQLQKVEHRQQGEDKLEEDLKRRIKELAR